MEERKEKRSYLSGTLCGTQFALRPETRQSYPSVYGIYIAPLQGNYSEALPAQARAKRKVLRKL